MTGKTAKVFLLKPVSYHTSFRFATRTSYTNKITMSDDLETETDRMRGGRERARERERERELLCAMSIALKSKKKKKD